ncbi:UNVERIFIED_CONTAM: hypothetical protein K2H54_055160 [Gekko kuhli]
MPNRKCRRSSSDVTNLKEVKQQRIDKFVTNTQPGAVQLSNKYAVLAENLQTAPCEEEEKSLAEISMQQQCCQQLLSTIMELFSKEAILTSQSLALLLVVKEWETHGIQEIELDLRSHQVITMSSGAPIEVKSLALELKEAEADQARVQQFQSIAREVKPKEAERKLSWPVKEAQVPQNTNKRSTELQFYQGGERALLASSLQEEMLDNSTEEEFYNMFADLTPQEQQAVTKRLEYTKNCLLARKKDERFKQQAIQDDNMVNSSANVLTQTLQVTKLLPSSEVEMDIEQEINGSSEANVDFLQTTKNGSIFIDRDRILDQINESE